MSEYIIRSELSATVWKVEVSVGDQVSVEDTLVILESMKMEIPVTAPVGGVVQSIDVTEGASVVEGQTLLVLSY